jgi:HK97 gp10 family phage protein
MTVSFKLKGADDLRKALEKAVEKAPGALAKAMLDEADKVLEEAKANAPVDTGRLRDSGAVSSDLSGDKLEVGVTFDTDYAIAVHERMERRGNKFLERAFLERASKIPAEYAEAVEKELKKL